ncbi:Transmembrane protein 19 [Actinomortierella ambigua]|nr:Transmembrane protein 19 [Actinomortierella ambigua]
MASGQATSPSVVPLGLGTMLYPAALCAFMVQHGLSKKSLSTSGAVAATVVGMGTFTHLPGVFGTVLLTFYLSSSRLTKYKAQIKKTLEEDHQEGGARTAIQVFSNGATGTALALAFQYVFWTSAQRPATLFYQDWRASTLLFAYIGHYACCNGDTWSSELGILSKSWPTLITTLKKVPPGTNGGVSWIGLVASVAGGATIGAMAAVSVLVQQWREARVDLFGLIGGYLAGAAGQGQTDEMAAALRAWQMFTRAVDARFLVGLALAGAGAGLFGSLLDSLLGATVQKSNYSSKRKVITYRKEREDDDEIKAISGWDILDNHQVNFVSSLLIAGLTGYLSWRCLW